MDSRDFVKEVEALDLPDKLWDDIVRRQTILMEQYKLIEQWHVSWPLDLNSKESQLLIKDMLARTVEELAEGFESFLLGNMDNTFEELADALHFLTEAFILSGIKFGEWYDPILKNVSNSSFFALGSMVNRNDTVANYLWDVTYECNIARNALRNKPWKQTQMLYNKIEFENHLCNAVASLFRTFNLFGFTPEAIWREYVKKNKVNLFRINSKY